MKRWIFLLTFVFAALSGILLVPGDAERTHAAYFSLRANQIRKFLAPESCSGLSDAIPVENHFARPCHSGRRSASGASAVSAELSSGWKTRLFTEKKQIIHSRKFSVSNNAYDSFSFPTRAGPLSFA